MAHIMFFGVNREKSIMACHTIDVIGILPFIRGRDYKINLMTDSEGSSLLAEDDEPSWVRSDHYADISRMIELDNEKGGIECLKIDFENGDGLYFFNGEFVVQLSDPTELKRCTMAMLEQYGYFASEQIFEFAKEEDLDLPIYIVCGMTEEELGDSLSLVKEAAFEILEEDKLWLGNK